MIWGLSSEPIMFIFTSIFVINSSLIPQLLLKKVCLDQYNQTICDNIAQHKKEQVEVQEEATLWAMIIFLCELVPAFFMVLMWGPLTDIFGRRKKLIYLTLAMGMQNMALAFCAHFPDSSPAYLIIASLAAGTYGSASGVTMITYSIIADVTKTNLVQRTKRMTLLGFCIYTASVLSGVVSGHFVLAAGYTVVFLTNCGLTLVLYLYILILTGKRKRDQYENLNEQEEDGTGTFSMANENGKERERSSISSRSSVSSFRYRDIDELNPFKLMKQVYQVIVNNESKTPMFFLLITNFCSACVLAGDIYVLPLYLKNAPFNFSPEWIGYYITLYNGVGGISLGVLHVITHVFQVSDILIILLGIASQATLYILTGIARGIVLLFIARAACMFYSVSPPAILSHLTKLTSSKEYGAVLGILSLIHIFGLIVVSFAGLGIYQLTLALYSGTVFFVISGVSVIGIIMLCITYFLTKQ